MEIRIHIKPKKDITKITILVFLFILFCYIPHPPITHTVIRTLEEAILIVSAFLKFISNKCSDILSIMNVIGAKSSIKFHGIIHNLLLFGCNCIQYLRGVYSLVVDFRKMNKSITRYNWNPFSMNSIVLDKSADSGNGSPYILDGWKAANLNHGKSNVHLNRIQLTEVNLAFDWNDSNSQVKDHLSPNRRERLEEERCSLEEENRRHTLNSFFKNIHLDKVSYKASGTDDETLESHHFHVHDWIHQLTKTTESIRVNGVKQSVLASLSTQDEILDFLMRENADLELIIRDLAIRTN